MSNIYSILKPKSKEDIFKDVSKLDRYKLNFCLISIISKDDNEFIIKTLYDAGADINAIITYWTPLSLAARCECIKNIKILIELGADINMKNGYDKTPIELAFNIDVIKLLREHGAV